MAHVSGEFSVGADQGDAVGNGLGDDQAVVGVAVVVVERKGGEGVEVPFRQRLHLNAGSPYTAEDVRGVYRRFLTPYLADLAKVYHLGCAH